VCRRCYAKVISSILIGAIGFHRLVVRTSDSEGFFLVHEDIRQEDI